jgi:predicted lysophospholipase L1 biosynthesis ABC-type transport system permease subunit
MVQPISSGSDDHAGWSVVSPSSAASLRRVQRRLCQYGIYVVGIAVFVAGLAIVQKHNVWTGGWPVLVTIFGWFLLVAGLMQMLFPVQLAEIAVNVIRAFGVLIGAVIVQLLLGAFFPYLGHRPS